MWQGVKQKKAGIFLPFDTIFSAILFVTLPQLQLLQPQAPYVLAYFLYLLLG